MNWVMVMGLFRYKPSTFQSFSIGNIKLFSLEKLSRAFLALYPNMLYFTNGLDQNEGQWSVQRDQQP